MTAQHVIAHLQEIEFWKELRFKAIGKTLDWCDRLACETNVLRLKGKSAEQIEEQLKRWIAKGDHAEWELNHDGVSVPTEEPPEITAVIERANELTALFQKQEAS